MEIVLWIQSNRKLASENLLELGLAYDRHPSLRPVRLGEVEPFRVRVGTSMSDALSEFSIPLSLMGVSRNTFLSLELSTPSAAINQGLPADLVTNIFYATFDLGDEPSDGQYDEVSSLFKDLCAALLADVGYAMTLEDWLADDLSIPEEMPNRVPNAHEGILGVVWMHYFGPKYLAQFPDLKSIESASPDQNGGLVLRVTPDPRSFISASSPDPSPAASSLTRMRSEGIFARSSCAAGVPAASPRSYDNLPDTPMKAGGGRGETNTESSTLTAFPPRALMTSIADDLGSGAPWSTTIDVDGFLICWNDLAGSEALLVSPDLKKWITRGNSQDRSAFEGKFSGSIDGGSFEMVVRYEDDSTVEVYVWAPEGVTAAFDAVFP